MNKEGQPVDAVQITEVNSGNAIRRSISKSTSELQNSGSSTESATTDRPHSRTRFALRRKIQGGTKSKMAFMNTLRNMLGGQTRRTCKRGTTDNARSSSHPDVSLERQDSMAGYGGDTSSAGQSSPATPYSSPRRLHSYSVSQSASSSKPITHKVSSSDPHIDSKMDKNTSLSEKTETTSISSRLDEEINRTRIKALRDNAFFQLNIHLKKGIHLVPKDTCVTRHKTNLITVGRCTSDPYVKFKVGGKVVFKSKTVYKDLNPVWDESFTLGIEDPFDPVQIKVFDYDWGLQDDFMGLTTIDLTKLDLNKSHELSLTLQEPGKHEYMGTINLNATLFPKTQEDKDQYLTRGGSKLQEQQRRLKSQIWSSVVTIVLVEARNLSTMDPDGFCDPYVKFRLGNEKYKSKVEVRTKNPRWLEQFDFHLFDDQLLEVCVFDKDSRLKEDFIGKCVLDMKEYEREMTHHICVDLECNAELPSSCSATIFLLLTISGTTSSASISDLISHKENPHELKAIKDRYKISRSFHNMRDVGFLTVKVYKAQGLAAADFGVGKSDPFCVLELVNARLQTQTEYKTLCPSWNKIFTFDVKDMYSVLEVTVYDEDRDHKVDFLGKVAIPLYKIRNGEKKWYALKDKKLRLRAKGNYPQILLECSAVWNTLRGSIHTFDPKEVKYMSSEPKFKRQIFVRNVNRIRAILVDVIDFGLFIKSCFEWEFPMRSLIGFILFMLITYYFEVYMIVLCLLLIFLKNYLVLSIVGPRYHKEEDPDSSGNEDDFDDDDKDKEEKKSLKEKLQAIQEVIATVQNAIGSIATVAESIKNTFNFTIPFLSHLMILVLLVVMVVLYFVPLRFLVMLWGIAKFSRKLIRPHSVVNDEILDFLSRVPDNEQLKDCHELRLKGTSLEDRRRRDVKRKKAS